MPVRLATAGAPVRAPFRLRSAGLLATGALLALAACADAPSGPRPTEETPMLAIIPAAGASVPGLDGKQLSLSVGDSARLSGVFRRGTGGDTPATVSWRSLDPAVAAVDGSGLLRALANGATSVIASADRQADTLRVVVGRCGSTRAVALGVGQVDAFGPGQGLELCVVGGAAEQEYAIVPVFTADLATRQASLTVTGSNVGAVLPDVARADRDVAVAGGPALSRAAASAPARLDGDAPLVTDAPFLQRLRRQEALEPSLAYRTATAGGVTGPLPAGPSRSMGVGDRATPSADAVAQQVTPRIGELMRLNTRTEAPSGQRASCDTITSAFRVGRVVAVGTRSVVVADTGNPVGTANDPGFTDADYRHFAAAFDTLAWPVVTENFGQPSDMDRNQRVVIFFTRAVNELTPRGADYVVGGFFWERDLFARRAARRADDCAGSNEAEMFYMLAPDPDPRRAINGNVRTTSYLRRVTVNTIGHEFQHLVNAARRISVNAPDFEQVWLNEGLSHVAEELMFHRAAGLQPRQRITYPQINRTPATFATYNEFGNDNLRRLISYLGTTETASPFTMNDELETRGATWQFLRYAADRLAATGRGEATLWRALAESRSIGRANLQAVFGTSVPLDEWVRDWAVANYADTRAPALTGLDARYTFPSWSFRSVVQGYVDQEGRPFALRTRTLVPEEPASLSLNGGSAAFLRFTVRPGQQATIRTRPVSVPTQGALRLAVVRVR